MSAVLSPPKAAVRRDKVPMLRLLGPVAVCRAGRCNAPWAYAKLPALLALLGSAGGKPVARQWIAALLWPERDAAALRRALYDLRRQLRDGTDRAPPIGASRPALWLHASLPTDIGQLDAAWRASQAGTLEPQRGVAALELWEGEFAAGLAVPGADDFELWLMQARAQWQQRALSLALSLAAMQLDAGRRADALQTARKAVERAPDADAAHAMLWRCQVAQGQRLLAVQDWRQHRAALAKLGLPPSGALSAEAAALGLAGDTPAKADAPAAPGASVAGGTGHDALVLALQKAMRQGPGGEAVERLLVQAEARLERDDRGADIAARVLLLRRTFMLRLMHSPWHDRMLRLSAHAEAMLCEPLTDVDRLDLVQPLAIWHGWMGRGVRGEVLLRSLGDIDGAELPAATRVRHLMTLALCHSCSTGDAERSIKEARHALRVARAGAVPGCRTPLSLLVVNAALNRGAPGDAAVAERALAQALEDAPLQRFDLVNHHQLSAQWQLEHGSAARALAEAELGERMAAAVPFPMQGLACALLAISARMLLGDEAVARPLAGAEALARRIGAQGLLISALVIGAAHARRSGDAGLAAARSCEAQSIARACGARRIRKVPEALLREALAAG